MDTPVPSSSSTSALDTFEHEPREGCGCDLCVAAADDLHTIATALRDAAIDDMEARALAFDAALDAEPDAPLPWEDAFEPACHALAPPRDPRPCVDCGRAAYVAKGEAPYCLACVTHLLTLSLEAAQKIEAA